MKPKNKKKTNLFLHQYILHQCITNSMLMRFIQLKIHSRKTFNMKIFPIHFLHTLYI